MQQAETAIIAWIGYFSKFYKVEPADSFSDFTTNLLENPNSNQGRE